MGGGSHIRKGKTSIIDRAPYAFVMQPTFCEIHRIQTLARVIRDPRWRCCCWAKRALSLPISTAVREKVVRVSESF